jgi:hypothetical protein
MARSAMLQKLPQMSEDRVHVDAENHLRLVWLRRPQRPRGLGGVRGGVSGGRFHRGRARSCARNLRRRGWKCATSKSCSLWSSTMTGRSISPRICRVRPTPSNALAAAPGHRSGRADAKATIGPAPVAERRDRFVPSAQVTLDADAVYARPTARTGGAGTRSRCDRLDRLSQRLGRSTLLAAEALAGLEALCNTSRMT